jgi:hypothetical protein
LAVYAPRADELVALTVNFRWPQTTAADFAEKHVGAIWSTAAAAGVRRKINLVPADSFAEYAPEPKTKKKDVVSCPK